ncbi:MAG TPA: pyridoxamine 5'-phosphate oxidase family protein, partial [Gaiellaceae bacterium]|nr:pyridoxamine 5'-phosphate oxidase family protein [Gaiellaceae bacterium]
MRRSRPGFGAEYGISEDEEGMLPWSWADERLAASRNYWIVTAGDDGEPSAAPVWGVWADGAVYFGTSPRSRKGQNLAHDPRVVIHLESGDEVVILHGEVEVEDVDDSILDAYEAKYGYRPPAKSLFRLSPRRALAWLETD